MPVSAQATGVVDIDGVGEAESGDEPVCWVGWAVFYVPDIYNTV